MKPTNPEGAEDACDTPRRYISERETARTIIGLLLCEPQPWTRAELARELGGHEVATHDAVENLIRAGLANREGEAVSASRAARVFEELEP
jgi:predicted ArsR family transcriptional regulator